jgi:hypothetical protein
VVLWALGLPGHTLAPNWFFPVHWRGLDPSPWALALALPIPWLAWRATKSADAHRHALAIALLVVTSLAAQGSALLLVGPRLETALDRFDGGHGEFLVAARAHHDHVLDAIRAYPEEVEAGRLGGFAASKPPGTFAYYALVDAISRTDAVRPIVASVLELARERRAFRTRAASVATAVLFFPLTTALVVIPIVLLGLALTGRARDGYDAALLWATCPAVLVITHHTDGALYPLLAVTGCAAAGVGARRGNLALSALGGAVLGVAVWCSYGLLPAIGLALGAQLVAALDVDRVLGPARVARRAVLHWVALAIGVAAGLGALYAAGLFPEPIESYREAMFYHWRWKLGFVGGVYGLTGGAEFWAWAGLPLLVMFLVAALGALGALGTPARRPLAVAALGVLAVHVFVMLYAGSNESARLWLFQLPFVCAIVAADLRRASPIGRPRRLLALAVAANLLLVPITRAAQVW